MDNESSLSIWSGRSDMLDALQVDQEEITKIKRKVMEAKYQKRKDRRHQRRLSHSMKRNSAEFGQLPGIAAEVVVDAAEVVVDAATGQWCRNLKLSILNATENGLLLPNGRIRLGWDVFVGLFVLYICIALPISLAFGKEITILEYIVDIFFLVDIVVNVRTAYYDRENNLVADTKKCRNHYLFSRWFVLDLVSSIPWAIILNNITVEGDSIQTLGTLRGLKIIRLVRLVRLFRMLSHMSNSAMVSAARMFAIFMLGAHWFGCLFHLIAVSENVPNNWRSAQGVVPGIEEYPWESQYLLALYWSIVTITTVGYGDISPVTEVEQVFTLGVICVGTLLYMSVFGVIAAVASSLIDDNPVYREKMQAVESFARNSQLSRSVQRRLIAYYEFHWDQRHSFDKRESILDDFPDALRVEVANEINIRMLLKSKLFSVIRSPTVDLRHTDLVDVLAAALSSPKVSESHICLEDEYLFYKGDTINNVYFILKGTVEMSSKQMSTQLTDGGLLGTIGIFEEVDALDISAPPRDPTDPPAHKTQAVAIEMTDLYCLHRESFLTALEYFGKARDYIRWVSQKKTNLFAGLEPIDATELTDPYEFLSDIPVVDSYERSTGSHKVYSDEHIVEKLANYFVAEYGSIFEHTEGLALQDTTDASTAFASSFRGGARNKRRGKHKKRNITGTHKEEDDVFDEHASIGSEDLAINIDDTAATSGPEDDGGLAGAVERRQRLVRMKMQQQGRVPGKYRNVFRPDEVASGGGFNFQGASSAVTPDRLELIFSAISGRLDRIERNQIKLKNEIRQNM